ncbi:hypothetical protein LINGRAHAP2_LOCUS33128 [Linum grandiflorum]
MVQFREPDRLSRPKSHQPVILPLAREGGDRCSVKPASRIALLSRNQATSVFTEETMPNSSLGTGGPDN